MDYEESIERSSGYFLYENLPEGWADLPEEGLLKFLEEHAWEPFEFTPGDTLWGYIDGLAHEFREVANLARQKALTGQSDGN